VELYLHSPIQFHGVVFNLKTPSDNFTFTLVLYTFVQDYTCANVIFGWQYDRGNTQYGCVRKLFWRTGRTGSACTKYKIRASR